MKTLAIEINDVGVRGRNADGELFDSPGLALVDGTVLVGEAVQRQARLQPGRVMSHFWSDLSLETLPSAMRGAATVADLAYHHLNALWSQASAVTERVLLVVPGHYSREQLSLILGIARECGMPVEGLVDMALVAAERPVPGRQLIHVELMLDRIVLTRLTQGRQLRRDSVDSVKKSGLRTFQDLWARAISDVFVRNTRYDPMHTAESEQQFYDRLPGWVAGIHRDGSATLVVENGGREHSIVVKNETLAVAAEDLFRQLARHVAGLSRPGEKLAVLLSDRLQNVPGLHAALRAAVSDCDLIDLAPGAAARGALRRETELASGPESVAYVTSVAWDRGSSPRVELPTGTRPQGPRPPTHVVYLARAWRINEQPLHIGVDSGDGARSLIVTGDTHGVSGQHCTLRHVGSDVVLTDQSRYGTFVNDRRVEGDVKLNYGDIVRLGTSDHVLQMIVAQDSDVA